MVGCGEVESKIRIFLNQFITVAQTDRRISSALSSRITYCTQHDLSAVQLTYMQASHMAHGSNHFNNVLQYRQCNSDYPRLPCRCRSVGAECSRPSVCLFACLFVCSLTQKRTIPKFKLDIGNDLQISYKWYGISKVKVTQLISAFFMLQSHFIDIRYVATPVICNLDMGSTCLLVVHSSKHGQQASYYYNENRYLLIHKQLFQKYKWVLSNNGAS